jgi:chromosome segregation ATPase
MILSLQSAGNLCLHVRTSGSFLHTSSTVALVSRDLSGEHILQKELADVESKLAKVATELHGAEKEQQALRDDQSRFSSDIADAQAEKGNLEDCIVNLTAELRNLRKKKEKAERDSKGRADEIATVEKVCA